MRMVARYKLILSCNIVEKWYYEWWWGWWLRIHFCCCWIQIWEKFKINYFAAYLMTFSRSTLLRSEDLLQLEHLLLSFWPSSNWLGQVMWHKKYWWHHSVLSTRPHSSTSLVTSVKVSWLRPRTPEVSFEYYT